MRNIKDFGRYIAENRKKVGMTQEQFATKLGITPQAVSKWENGIGYPDVALFPSIAALLSVSIESLFTGSARLENEGFPPSLCGMALVGVHEQYACYSDKIPAQRQEHRIDFLDGSTADLRERLVHNNGQGEILLTTAEDLPHTAVPEAAVHREQLDRFDTLHIAMAVNCDIDILPAPDGIPRLEAVGSPCFLGALHVHHRQNTLKISAHSLIDESEDDRYRLTVYTPVVGCALDVQLNSYGDCRILTDYEEIELTLSGYPTTILPCLSRCRRLAVRGGGLVFAAGHADTLECDITGFAEIHAGGLCVQQATLFTQASATITLGHIRKQSIEQLHKGTSLTVGRRGEQ